jgi:hypothetical protein
MVPETVVVRCVVAQTDVLLRRWLGPGDARRAR